MRRCLTFKGSFLTDQCKPVWVNRPKHFHPSTLKSQYLVITQISCKCKNILVRHQVKEPIKKFNHETPSKQELEDLLLGNMIKGVEIKVRHHESKSRKSQSKNVKILTIYCGKCHEGIIQMYQSCLKNDQKFHDEMKYNINYDNLKVNRLKYEPNHEYMELMKQRNTKITYKNSINNPYKMQNLTEKNLLIEVQRLFWQAKQRLTDEMHLLEERLKSRRHFSYENSFLGVSYLIRLKIHHEKKKKAEAEQKFEDQKKKEEIHQKQGAQKEQQQVHQLEEEVQIIMLNDSNVPKSTTEVKANDKPMISNQKYINSTFVEKADSRRKFGKEKHPNQLDRPSVAKIIETHIL